MSRLRSRLARTGVGLAVAVGALVGVTAATTSVAHADTIPNSPRCVSRNEFRRLRAGMTVTTAMTYRQAKRLLGRRPVSDETTVRPGITYRLTEWRTCANYPSGRVLANFAKTAQSQGFRLSVKGYYPNGMPSEGGE